VQAVLIVRPATEERPYLVWYTTVPTISQQKFSPAHNNGRVDGQTEHRTGDMELVIRGVGGRAA
jgi:hypothetical protein